ncbi:clan AA aspartic protease [Flavobacterium sp. CYK-55]|uniref:retropepsin-like aspartic protease n=1 Tax=Flavobacterium sp. CYK-55 TaxID=2835529 RepID=UPI001BD074B1|nr:retropepsin-like aspartic protease [Flavobacterium sp. CYK-55]MBS7787858.1 clan AA aspartic protease [Flavobacterium sp. CYK-55]
MEKLPDLLHEQGYKKIKFKVSKTQHLLVKAKINGVAGWFILDTGASNSCVGFEGIELFKLSPENSSTKAAGAGATGMYTQIAPKNILQIGRWKTRHFPLVVFDLSHVNQALSQHKAQPVQGIIGADVLLSGHAIIDYYHGCVYLQ